MANEELNVKINIDVSKKRSEAAKDKLKKTKDKLGTSKKTKLDFGSRSKFAKSAGGAVLGKAAQAGGKIGKAGAALKSGLTIAGKLLAFVSFVTLAIGAILTLIRVIVLNFGTEIDELAKKIGFNSEVNGKLSKLLDEAVDSFRATLAEVPSAAFAAPTALGVATDFARAGAPLSFDQQKAVFGAVKDANVRNSVENSRQTDENIKNFIKSMEKMTGFGE